MKELGWRLSSQIEPMKQKKKEETEKSGQQEAL